MSEEELKLVKQQMLRNARKASIVMGLAAVIAVLFMVYGFSRSIEADMQRDLANSVREEAQKEISILKEQLAQCQSEKNK